MATVSRTTLTALLLLAIAGCNGSPEPSDPELQTLTLMYGSQGSLFAPGLDDSPKFLVFLPLRENFWECWGRQEWTARYGWPPPGLAESMESSDEGHVWTVRLRDDLFWHDGVPVTAHDIAYTIELWKHPDVQHYGGAPVESVTVLDDHTLRFELSDPGGWYDMTGWDVYYPKHLIEDLPPEEFFDWDFWWEPVGNGPFRVLRTVPRQVIELEPHEPYPYANPGYDRLRVKLGGSSPVTELLAGNVDLSEVSLMDIEPFRDDPDYRVEVRAYGPGIWWFWNLRDSRFSDLRVRKAMVHAIDRRAMLGSLGLPWDLPLTDGVFTGCQLRRGELLPAYEHDPARARELLEEAGWRKTGEGLRMKDGRAFRFELTVTDRYEPEAVFIHDQLRAVGIEAEIRIMEYAAIRERFRAGDFEAAMPRLPGPWDYLGANSPFGYDNPRVRQLMAQTEQHVEWSDRAPAFREISEITRDELAVFSLRPRVRSFVASDRVRGLEHLFETGSMMGLERLHLVEPGDS